MGLSQERLDQLMVDTGIERYFRSVRNSGRGESFSAPILRLSKVAAVQIHEALELILSNSRTKMVGRMADIRKFVGDVGTTACSILVLEILISYAGSEKATKAKIGNSLARLLMNELKFRSLKGDNPELYKILKDLQVGKSRTSYREKLNRHLRGVEDVYGVQVSKEAAYLLIEVARQRTGLFTYAYVRPDSRSPRTDVYLSWSKEAEGWIDDAHLHFSKMGPIYLPMVSRPVDWDEEGLFGGYVGDPTLIRPAISQVRSIRKRLKTAVPPTVVTALNSLQSTKWRVNKRVLAVMESCWERGIAVGDLISREPIPVPEFPEEARTDKVVKVAWCREARVIHTENSKALSTKVNIERSLRTARLFRDEEEMYFPHFADFRGRIYPRPIGLNPQGEEYVKALMEFKQGHYTDDSRWLCIEGANRWGNDKVSHKERMDWVASRLDWILAIADDPYSNRGWEEADKPWMFLAWCFAYAEWAQGDGSVNLPCYTDGSNNGLQIYSLLLRDPDSGRSTNCTPGDHPQDIYREVADTLAERLSNSDTPHAQYWVGFFDRIEGVPRALVKRPVMTLAYGVTRYSVTTQVWDWYRETAKELDIDIGIQNDGYQRSQYLARELWECMKGRITSAAVAMKWMSGCVRTMAKHGVAVEWTAPSGFKVASDYLKWERRKGTTIHVFETKVYCRYRSISDEVDPRASANAVCPNYVHSLDAACTAEIVTRLKAEGIYSVSSIHDSYAVHPGHMPTLNRVIREVYSTIFSEDLLRKLWEGWSQHLPPGVKLPEPPYVGGLDIDDVEQSDYFFS